MSFLSVKLGFAFTAVATLCKIGKVSKANNVALREYLAESIEIDDVTKRIDDNFIVLDKLHGLRGAGSFAIIEEAMRLFRLSNQQVNPEVEKKLQQHMVHAVVTLSDDCIEDTVEYTDELAQNGGSLSEWSRFSITSSPDFDNALDYTKMKKVSEYLDTLQGYCRDNGLQEGAEVRGSYVSIEELASTARQWLSDNKEAPKPEIMRRHH